MYCTNCGALLDKEAIFCPSCGMRVAVDFDARDTANPENTANSASSPAASNDLTQPLSSDETKQILEDNGEAFAAQEVTDDLDDSGLFVDNTSMNEAFLVADNAPTEYIPAAANAPVSAVAARQAASPRRDRSTIIAAVAIAVLVLATCAVVAIIFGPAKSPMRIWYSLPQKKLPLLRQRQIPRMQKPRRLK